MLEKTDGTIKNGQSRDIGNVGQTIHREIHFRENRWDHQEWTIQRYWQGWAHNTQDK